MATLTRSKRRPPPAPLNLPKRSSYRSPITRQAAGIFRETGELPPLPPDYNLATHIGGLITILTAHRINRQGLSPAVVMKEVEDALFKILKSYEGQIEAMIE